MSFVLASPGSTPSGGLPQGFSMSWTGWDGSTWSMSTRADGLVVGPGVRGLGAPPVRHFRDESPAVDGARWRGVRTLSREVFWPLWVLHDAGAQDWVYRDRAFWATLDPEQPGQWTVTQPTGDYRTLACRFESGDDVSEIDPALIGWATYGVYLSADDPYWLGVPVTESWGSGGTVPYFSTSGSVYGRSPANLLGTATMSNRGDVDAFPVWTITAGVGGITTTTIGVGGRLIVVPIALTEGQSITVDTRPAARTAIRENGTDVTSSLGAVDFAPIPAGEAQSLSLSMTGTGTVSASITPRFRRAW